MLKNYLTTAWRNLFRTKSFAFTNLLGLTIGMTSAILIFLWVQDELSYNKFQAHYDHIYQVMAHRNFNNQVFTDENMVFPLDQALQQGYPAIRNAVVTSHRQSNILEYQQTKLKKEGYTVGKNYFAVFSWKFLHGNAATAISDPSSIALTESAARALFGQADPINKVVRIDNGQNATVTAVLADPPANSSLQFDYIRPYNYAEPDVKAAMNEWGSSSWNVFVQTVPGADVSLLEKHVNTVKKKHDPNDAVSTYFAFPMRQWRLYSEFRDGKNVGGMIEYVRLFTVIAFVILLMACVNFMNLSTARSEKRAKEVGIRKTVGSTRQQLIGQFLCESLLLTVMAFLLSVAAVYALLPSFNALVDKRLALDLAEPMVWMGAVVIVVFTGAVAGSYPAFYLSSFNAIKVLKGTFLSGRKAVLPRRILVVTQFVAAIGLISATLIVYRQIQHVKNRALGYDTNNLLMLPTSGDINRNFAVLKQELLQTGKIGAVTRASGPITEIWWRSGSPDYEGKPANANIIFNGLATDVDFTRTVGVKMLQGRDFSGSPADSLSMLLNKAAVEAMALPNPVGMQMRYGQRKYSVIGVMDNIVIQSPYQPVDPLMVYYNPNQASRVHIRLRAGVAPAQALSLIEASWKKHNPAFPFEYQFVDEEFGKKFLTEELIGTITRVFAGLAIFICGLGLAGLASFTIEKRIREIGIRKVLGASIQQLLLLISKEFLRLVLIACLIAIPLTWWFMHDWLQKYPYRTDISLWLFAGVGLVILLLTMLVVSLNTWKAANTNPVKNLRTE